MKKFRKRYQELSQRAAQFKQALEAAPAKAAEVRQIITRTVGEFQQLKDDFRVSSAAFPEVMEQIAAGAGALDETGYSLDRVEMDMGVNSRLIVYLNRGRATSARALRDLQAKHQGNVAMRGLLTALIKAEELAGKVDLPGMTYGALAVEMGMIPCVRLAWLSDAEYVEEGEKEAVQPPPLPAASTPASSTIPSQPSALFGQGAFFERRATTPPSSSENPPAPEPVQEARVVPTAPESKETPAPTVPSAGDWRKDALARFKKMPDLSKYHR